MTAPRHRSFIVRTVLVLCVAAAPAACKSSRDDEHTTPTSTSTTTTSTSSTTTTTTLPQILTRQPPGMANFRPPLLGDATIQDINNVNTH